MVRIAPVLAPAILIVCLACGGGDRRRGSMDGGGGDTGIGDAGELDATGPGPTDAGDGTDAGDPGTDAGPGEPACAMADGRGFFADCSVCEAAGRDCDTIDVGGGPRSACDCASAADCPCGFRCDCIEIAPMVRTCNICVR